MIFHGNQVKNFLKENVQVSIYFMKDANEPDIFRIKKSLEDKKAIKEIHYISKQEARQIMAKNLGEEAGELLGYNPYPPSLDVYFNADFTNADTLQQFKEKWEANNQVKEVFYEKALVENIDRYIRIASFIVLGLAVIFLLIAIALINSTIRLSLYSSRFLIKSMQLVGASRWFIRKPFVYRSMLHGLLGGFLASLLLILILYFLQDMVPFMDLFGHSAFYLILFGSMLILGSLITGLSGLFSINKYLKMKLEDLY